MRIAIVSGDALLKLLVRHVLEQLRKDGSAKIQPPLSDRKSGLLGGFFRSSQFKSFPAGTCLIHLIPSLLASVSEILAGQQ